VVADFTKIVMPDEAKRAALSPAGAGERPGARE
jgi:hypothetical protein